MCHCLPLLSEAGLPDLSAKGRTKKEACRTDSDFSFRQGKKDKRGKGADSQKIRPSSLGPRNFGHEKTNVFLCPIFTDNELQNAKKTIVIPAIKKKAKSLHNPRIFCNFALSPKDYNKVI